MDQQQGRQRNVRVPMPPRRVVRQADGSLILDCLPYFCINSGHCALRGIEGLWNRVERRLRKAIDPVACPYERFQEVNGSQRKLQSLLIDKLGSLSYTVRSTPSVN